MGCGLGVGGGSAAVRGWRAGGNGDWGAQVGGIADRVGI